MEGNMSGLYDLKVNSRKCALGIDDDRIYFGWKFDTDAQGVMQQSAQVRLCEAEQGEVVWDSGVCETAESAYFIYKGEMLKPATRYHWTVEAVDNHGCTYTGESWFETGLMGSSKEVWDGARFVGSPYDSVNTDSLAAYTMESDFCVSGSGRTGLAFNVRDKDNYMAVELDFASGSCLVRRYNDAAWTDAVPFCETLGNNEGYSFAVHDLKNDGESEVSDEEKNPSKNETANENNQEHSYHGRLKIGVEGTKLSLFINDRIVIDGEDILPKNAAFMPRIEGMGNLGVVQNEGRCELEKLVISYTDNGMEHVMKKYDELVVENEFYVFNPAGAVCVRKCFDSDGPIKRARLYATAMGFYDVFINGSKVNKGFYNPGFTDYRKRLMYQTYDVTDALKAGENVIGAVVMKGYYTGYVGYTAMPMVYGRKNAFLAKLVIEYADGSTKTIVTDRDWDFTDEGPVINADYQQGEYVDARRKIDWFGRNFVKCGIIDWPTKVIPTNGTLPDDEPFLITAQEGDEAEIERVLSPIAEYIENPTGHFVFDFGQNMVGTVKLTVCGTGKRGRSLKLRYGEMSYKNGRLYIANMRSAANTDCYTMCGEEREEFVPGGTSHGFRYVEISGNGFTLTQEELKSTLISVEGLVITNTRTMAGGFECSNEDVNKLQSNIVWGQRGNSLLVYTDCPQRNERMGWTGDAQVFIATAAYNMDIKNFMEKWLTDVRDGQLMYNRDGAVPDTAPLGGDNRRMGGCAGWGDAAVIVPWKLYLATGDIGILEKNYDMMRAWVEYQSRADRQFDGVRTVDGEKLPECSDISTEGYIQIQQSRGDHLTFDAGTPFILTATAYAAYVAGLLAKTARLLGKTDDALRYEKRHENVKRAFNEAWVKDDGSLAYWGEMSKSEPDAYGNIINRTRYEDGDDKTKRPSQTAYALALDFDLIPEDKRKKTADCLLQAVRDRDNKLSVGFLGIEHLAPALCKGGYYGMAFSLLTETGYPGWLYSVKNGATTIWERWNSYIAETGSFGDVSMNSFNHYSYGAIGEWLFDTVAGIRTSEGADGTGYRKIILTPHVGGGLDYVKAWHETPYGRVSSAYRLENGVLTYNCHIPANTTAKLILPVTGEEKELVSGEYKFTVPAKLNGQENAE